MARTGSPRVCLKETWGETYRSHGRRRYGGGQEGKNRKGTFKLNCLERGDRCEKPKPVKMKKNG